MKMKININKEIEISTDDLARALTYEELFALFTIAVNQMTEVLSYDTIRMNATKLSNNLSENSKRFIAEILSSEYIRNMDKS